ncbi:FRG domain-containing protein [Alcaligenes faecalis]|uniref:FRG domain-containing protein n=1 Tax=Alcaligenes faecalis TaxID=511 RepID=UPI0036559385
MTIRTISCLADLLSGLQEDVASYSGAIWFRGHSDASWQLLPSYLRLQSQMSEGTLLKRFKQSAALLLPREPKDSFDWLFLMQHYGLPTRLLDWTESPLVALYFAVHDTSVADDVDGALWILKPSELNKVAHINDQNEEFFIPSFEDEELANYRLEVISAGPKRTQLLPVASLATRNNTRIQAQLGVFTIHHLDSIAIEEVGDKSHTIKYEIPADARPNLRRELKLLGYSKFTLFPELSSIGENLRSALS